MSKSDENGESGGKQSSGARLSFRGVAGTLVALVIILSIAGFFAVRTEGFRTWVRGRIEKATGLQVTIDRTRIGWPYSLVMEGMTSAKDPAHTLARLKVDETRISLGMGGQPLVTMTGCALTLVRTKDGKWEPASCARLGELRDITQIAGLTTDLRTKVRLRIVRGSILWLDSKGNQIARAEDFNFTLDPITGSTGRKLHYCSLVMRELALEDGTVSHDVNAEWIITGDNRTVEIGYDEDDVIPPPNGGVRGGKAKVEETEDPAEE